MDGQAGKGNAEGKGKGRERERERRKEMVSWFARHLTAELTEGDVQRVREAAQRAKFRAKGGGLAGPAAGIPGATWTVSDYGSAVCESTGDGDGDCNGDGTAALESQVKLRLRQQWQQRHRSADVRGAASAKLNASDGDGKSNDGPTMSFDSAQQQQFFRLCSSYVDVFHSRRLSWRTTVEEHTAAAPPAHADSGMQPAVVAEPHVSTAAATEAAAVGKRARGTSSASPVHAPSFSAASAAAAAGGIARSVHEQTTDAYLLHVLNHVQHTRDLVAKNNEKLKQREEKERQRECSAAAPAVGRARRGNRMGNRGRNRTAAAAEEDEGQASLPMEEEERGAEEEDDHGNTKEERATREADGKDHAEEEHAENLSGGDGVGNDIGGDDDNAFRDQGFTRPKVLLLLPLRSTALRVVERLIDLTPSTQRAAVQNLDRFRKEFRDDDEEDGDEEEQEDIRGAKRTKREAPGVEPSALFSAGKRKKADGSNYSISGGANGSSVGSSGKPEDYEFLFSGNNDDHFRLGIKFTRKGVRLFSDFYQSDVIVASPIALVTLINEAEDDKDKTVDFLSSIEVVVVDSADVILMQNWAHMESVFSHLNRMPQQTHATTDFMRVREWYLNGWAPLFRQTIILSTFPNASIAALFHRACFNHAGKVKLRSHYDGILPAVISKVRQVYERVPLPLGAEAVAIASDKRFEFFERNVYPRLRDSLQGGVMIFVRSYFEFVRVRNFLKTRSASFCLLGEYTKQSDVSRARSWFFHGKRRILVYSQRAHFYHRFRIRGIRHLVFYSLPDYAHFYTEVLNMMSAEAGCSSTILFTRFDNLELERIVGTTRASHMLKSPNSTFMFC